MQSHFLVPIFKSAIVRSQIFCTFQMCDCIIALLQRANVQKMCQFPNCTLKRGIAYFQSVRLPNPAIQGGHRKELAEVDVDNRLSLECTKMRIIATKGEPFCLLLTLCLHTTFALWKQQCQMADFLKVFSCDVQRAEKIRAAAEQEIWEY